MKKLFTFVLIAIVAIFIACGEKNVPSSEEQSQTDSGKETNSDTTIVNEGELIGEFSVSSEIKVHFSKGNLQYQPSSKTYQFAENQYDYTGIAGNDIIASSSTKWMDLFGWGTGDNPLKTTRTNANYSPYLEWGDSIIINGRNKVKMWRTLTDDEWVYLFRERTNAENLFGFGTINNIRGLIILPDLWVIPDSITFATSIQIGGYWSNDSYTNSYNDNCAHNIYTIEQWKILESAGAVFLPMAGVRVGAEGGVSNIGSSGRYWSSSSYNSDKAYVVVFNETYFLPQQKTDRYYGHSVRLVR